MVGVLFPSLLLPVKISLKIFIERKRGEGGRGSDSAAHSSISGILEGAVNISPTLTMECVSETSLSFENYYCSATAEKWTSLLFRHPYSNSSPGIQVHLMFYHSSFWCLFLQYQLTGSFDGPSDVRFIFRKKNIYKRYWFDLVSSWKKATKSTVRKLTDPCT